MDYTFGGVTKYSLPWPISSGISCILAVLYFLHFIFRSMVHFELIFVKGIKFVSRFFFIFFLQEKILALWMSTCFSMICWKDCLCSIVFCLCFFVKGYVSLFLDSVLLRWYICPFFHQELHCLDSCRCIVSLEV